MVPLSFIRLYICRIIRVLRGVSRSIAKLSHGSTGGHSGSRFMIFQLPRFSLFRYL